jgi:hypothetical protein
VRAHLRRPLFWIVFAEVVVMFALFVVSWRVYQSHHPAPAISLPAVAEASPEVPASPPVAGRPATPPAKPRAPAPGGFPVDFGRLNADQASLEKVEDALLARIVEAARSYLESVVLPAVKRAESDRAATSPAARQSPAAIRKMP